VFWYQNEPHQAFGPLPSAEDRRPRAGDDPHDVAYRKLFALREKVFGLLIRIIVNNEVIPKDLEHDLKYGISQTYFHRDYDRLIDEADALERRIDVYLASTAKN
jgi:hypothetical protein